LNENIIRCYRGGFFITLAILDLETQVGNGKNTLIKRVLHSGFCTVVPCLSLTPCFSKVARVAPMRQPFQRFTRGGETVETVGSGRLATNTPRKWGVNENPHCSTTFRAFRRFCVVRVQSRFPPSLAYCPSSFRAPAKVCIAATAIFVSNHPQQAIKLCASVFFYPGWSWPAS
jgi:hypothetical protein